MASFVHERDFGETLKASTPPSGSHLKSLRAHHSPSSKLISTISVNRHMPVADRLHSTLRLKRNAKSPRPQSSVHKTHRHLSRAINLQPSFTIIHNHPPSERSASPTYHQSAISPTQAGGSWERGGESMSIPSKPWKSVFSCHTTCKPTPGVSRRWHLFSCTASRYLP